MLLLNILKAVKSFPVNFILLENQWKNAHLHQLCSWKYNHFKIIKETLTITCYSFKEAKKDTSNYFFSLYTYNIYVYLYLFIGNNDDILFIVLIYFFNQRTKAHSQLAWDLKTKTAPPNLFLSQSLPSLMWAPPTSSRTIHF